VNRFYWISLPGVVVATFLGRKMNRRVGDGRFVFYVHAGLAAIGTVLLLKALAKWAR